MRTISILVGAVLLALGLSTVPADAANCVRNRAVFCNHVATVAYVAPVVAYHAAAVQVIEVPVALDYYHSLANFNQASLIADAVVGRLALLDRQPGQQRPLATPKTAAAPMATPPAVPGSDEPSALLAKVVGDSCIRCHSGAKLGGGLDLSNLSAVPELERYKVSAWVMNGRMPKGGNPLSDEHAKLFADWADGFKVASK